GCRRPSPAYKTRTRWCGRFPRPQLHHKKCPLFLNLSSLGCPSFGPPIGARERGRSPAAAGSFPPRLAFPGWSCGLPNLDLAPAPRTKPLLGGVEGLGSLGASHTVAALPQGAAQSGWSIRSLDQLGDLTVRLLAEIPGRVEAGEGAQCHLR